MTYSKIQSVSEMLERLKRRLHLVIRDVKSILMSLIKITFTVILNFFTAKCNKIPYY